MKTTFALRIMGLCVMLSLVLSCQKENSSPQTPQEQEEFATVSSEADAEAEAVFNDVFDNVMGVNNEVAVGGTGVFGSANRGSMGTEVISGVADIDSITCFTITKTHLTAAAVFPVKIVIDFGAGCTGRDGRTRKGKVITQYSNRLTVAGGTATTTFDGYYVNDIKVEGTHIVSNQSTLNNPVFQVKVAGKLTKSNGNFSEWKNERTITQIEGQSTALPFDDVFKVSGFATGTVKKGDKLFQWATVITEPLVKKFSCHWIVKGAITIKKSNTAVAVLNYGTGQCDNKANFTVNSHVIEITLH